MGETIKMELLEYIKLYPLNAPTALDTFMRANLARVNPKELFLTPFLLPVFIANPNGYSPIINWYDRNPLNVVETYQNFVATGAKTTVWTYTVPANRKCYVENLQAKIMCTVVGGGANLDWCGFDLNGSLVGQASLYLQAIIGQQDNFQVGQSILLQSGDVLTGWHFINSGCTNWVNLNLKGTEFDSQ